MSEDHLIALFRSYAEGVSRDLPRAEEHLKWLFLMQHHHCGTRLLDWTESVLVALYFAVENESEDGELWCLHPGALNNFSVGQPLIITDLPEVSAVAEDAVKGQDHRGNKEVYPKGPVAIAPSIWFRRGINQLSRFTIHLRPGEGKEIPEILEKPNIFRYVIPKSSKKAMSRALHALGIRHESLFPDFDGVSRGIAFFNQLLEEGSIPCHVAPPCWPDESAKEDETHR